MLIGTLEGATSFKAINTLKTLTKSEKKILEKVFAAINDYDKSIAVELMDHILLSFTKENKDV